VQIDAYAGLDEGMLIPGHSHQVGYGSRVRDIQVQPGFGCLPAPVLITQVSISSVLVARPSRAPSAGPWACTVAKGIGGENDGTEFR
jgi:hypothetical protein